MTKRQSRKQREHGSQTGRSDTPLSTHSPPGALLWHHWKLRFPLSGLQQVAFLVALSTSLPHPGPSSLTASPHAPNTPRRSCPRTFAQAAARLCLRNSHGSFGSSRLFLLKQFFPSFADHVTETQRRAHPPSRSRHSTGHIWSSLASLFLSFVVSHH